MIEVKNLPTPDDLQPVRRALISVFDKTGIVDFARRLNALDIELLSTGGTARALSQAGLPVTDVSSVTGFPEILGGRVKTLHPAVHGGLLARRNSDDDVVELETHHIHPIDLVVVNLYPFEQAVAERDANDAIAAENIDIGGPTMIRAAAKNFFFVGVCTSPDDYDRVADTLEAQGGRMSLALRRELARRAFERTSSYDMAITRYFAGNRGSVENDGVESESRSSLPSSLRIDLTRAAELRYGENPHQRAALYGSTEDFFENVHGKALSFNNLLDLSAAINLIAEFGDGMPTCAILKHTNPCGVGTDDVLVDAYLKAFATDTQSPFGGIVVVNRPLDLTTAREIDKIFTEIIIAPSFEDGVLDFLQKKKNRRLVRLRPGFEKRTTLDVRTVFDGLLVQDRDLVLPPLSSLRGSFRVATQREPTDSEWLALDFAWRVVKHVKSNAIVYATDGATLGVGAGQMSRIDASEIAVMKSRKSGLDLRGCVVASDAFFPFADGLVAAADNGATAAIQPGGSIRDKDVIAAADDRGMAMVLTGKRHFRH